MKEKNNNIKEKENIIDKDEYELSEFEDDELEEVLEEPEEELEQQKASNKKEDKQDINKKFDDIEKELDNKMDHSADVDNEEIKKMKKSIDKLFTYVIGFELTGIFLCIVGATSKWCFIPGFIMVILGIVFIVFACNKRNKYIKKVKEEYLKSKINSKFPDLVYEPAKGYTEEYINDLHVYSEPAIFNSEDYFEGTIEDVSFSGADICLQDISIVKCGKSQITSYNTYFLGRVFTFEYNKRFDGEVLITEKNSYIEVKDNLVEQKLESIEFNEKFKVYADEPINAFYILTPDFMERILKIENKYVGDISILFRENFVYVFINDDVDTFDVDMSEVINEEQIEIMMKDVEIFEDLILELRLNEKIYK